MDTTDAPPTTPKRRAPRNPPPKLPVALAHDLDVARAARMGIDISYMAPGERCKYPSKFCCNIRARKSTGKLHRFCEDHRSRANVNQKRWNELRRRHEQAQQQLLDPSLLASSDLKAFTGMSLLMECSGHSKSDDGSPPHVATAATLPSACAELSDDEIDVLVAMVLKDEDSKRTAVSPSVVNHYWSWHPQPLADIAAGEPPHGPVDLSLLYTL